MAKNKSVIVKNYKRSTPSTPAYNGKGNKPGPKTVSVKSYRRSKGDNS